MTDYLITGAPGIPVSEGLGNLTEGLGYNLRPVITDPSATTPIEVYLPDTGQASISAAVNAQDFTEIGFPNTFANLVEGSTYVFYWKGDSYQYVGPMPVSVGVGGSYVTTPSDFITYVPPGTTTEHSELAGLGSPNAHPQSAITDLVSDQAAQDSAITAVEDRATTLEAKQPQQDAKIDANTANIGTNASEITRLDGENDAQDVLISSLQAEQVTQNSDILTNAQGVATNAQNLTDHQNASDPHGQYALETAVLDNFVAAGYGGIGDDSAATLPNITSTWIDYNTWDVVLIQPMHVTHELPAGVRFDREGIWQLNLKVSLAHNEAQAGRLMQARFFNHTLGAPSPTEFNYAIGRNQLATNIYININTTISAESVGHLFGLQLASGTDTFTSVVVLGSYWTINHVSEYKGQL